MVKDNKNIDNTLNDLLREYEVAPTANERLIISKKVRKYNFLRFSKSNFNIYYLLIILLVSFLLFYHNNLIFDCHQEDISKSTDKTEIHKKPIHNNDNNIMDTDTINTINETDSLNIIKDIDMSSVSEKNKKIPDEINKDLNIKTDSTQKILNEKSAQQSDSTIIEETVKNNDINEYVDKNKDLTEPVYDTIIETKTEIIIDTVREEVQETIIKRRRQRNR